MPADSAGDSIERTPLESAKAIRRDLSHLPGWPRLLSRDLAAAYCGIGVSTFDLLIEKGTLPRGLSLPGIRRTLWDRVRLDLIIDHMGGLDRTHGADDPEHRRQAAEREMDEREAEWKARGPEGRARLEAWRAAGRPLPGGTGRKKPPPAT